MARLVSKPLQGAMNLLILKTLSRGPRHGYAISYNIQKVSGDVLTVEEGSMYPSLHRMEKEGWISSQWALSETSRRVRFYKLTAKGKRQLVQEEAYWKRNVAAITKVLKSV